MMDCSFIPLSESSLSRVWQHITSGREWGIISAFKGDKTAQQNADDNMDLKRRAQQLQFGCFFVDGVWESEKLVSADIPKDKMPWSDDVHITTEVEVSLFIVPYTPHKHEKDFKKWLIRNGKLYNQESVIYGNEEGVFLIYMDGKVLKFTNTYYGEGGLEDMPYEDWKKLIERAKEEGTVYVRGGGKTQLRNDPKRVFSFKFEGLYCKASPMDMIAISHRHKLVETIKEIVTGDTTNG